MIYIYLLLIFLYLLLFVLMGPWVYGTMRPWVYGTMALRHHGTKAEFGCIPLWCPRPRPAAPSGHHCLPLPLTLCSRLTECICICLYIFKYKYMYLYLYLQPLLAITATVHITHSLLARSPSVSVDAHKPCLSLSVYQH